MGNNYNFQDDGGFVISGYNQTPALASFLPGISGAWGVPLWVFYVNRGQGIASFGVQDKDHAISEFFPADKAYSFTPGFGFRTFLNINKKTYYEPFQPEIKPNQRQKMAIKSDSLEIREANPKLGLDISVKYYTLPNTAIGALIRTVKIKNTSKRTINLQALDGLSRIIPYGAANYFLKDMSRTLEAWMRSSVYKNLAVFSLKVNPADVSHTEYIKGGNFNYCFGRAGNKKLMPEMIVDPETVFGPDASYRAPLNFINKSLKVKGQVFCGRTPCSFSLFSLKLKPGAETVFYSVFGAAFESEKIKKFVNTLSPAVLRKKETENRLLIEGIKNNADCKSNSQKLNNYIKSTYLDNVLRGGYPFRAGACGDNPYYIFTRKHGDLERDYNQFQVTPSYFSEGEGNYRDVNQNRRMDLFFEPRLFDKNIKYFFNLLKIDGYNPLVVKGEKLFLGRGQAENILKAVRINNKALAEFMSKGFFLGELFRRADELGVKLPKKNSFISDILQRAQRIPCARHGEGYWIDHWKYNLDSIESFLYFYPDKLGQLFLKKEFLFWDDQRFIEPRARRYGLRGSRVFQKEGVSLSAKKAEDIQKRKTFRNFLHNSRGNPVRVSLAVKLLSLILNKASTLDSEGIGIEMEAGKPGWCDSLNGLPALFGSSLPEALALKRAALILRRAVVSLQAGAQGEIEAPLEIYNFFKELSALLDKFFSGSPKNRDFIWWDKANSLKEDFRRRTFNCLSGAGRKLNLKELICFLDKLICRLNPGIKKAKDKKTGLYRAYFTYKLIKYRMRNREVIPLKFKRHNFAFSLEGPVSALRVEKDSDLHKKVKKSELYDKKLKMFKLNTSLNKESLEAGRSRVFTPGWLENESVWLHMEYKYLLELLKNQNYQEFYKSFQTCAACFFKPQVYGRSPYENSSFIVSSAYPDKNLWGRGYIARLSGATAELLNIWVLLCLGREPFYLDERGSVVMRFAPLLKKELFTADKTFSFKLFSSTWVTYHNPNRRDTFAKGVKPERIALKAAGRKHLVKGSSLPSGLSRQVREGKVEKIDVYFK